MFRTFGQEVLHFARAADSISDDDFRDVREVVQEYLETNFGLTKVEFLLESVAQGKRGLKPQWSDEDAYGAYPVLTDDDQPNGQLAFALLLGKPIWVVGASEGILVEEKAYTDLWSRSKEIPRFLRFDRSEEFEASDETTRMMIAIPLKSGGKSFAVLSCESDAIYTPNDAAKQELESIADALSILHFLKQRRTVSEEHTGRAVKELTKIAVEPIEFKTKKPALFLAYGEQKDPAVLAAIRDVLEPYRDMISVVDWEKVKPPGDITDWITEKILEAKYLICYLSDSIATKDGQTLFDDNSNVIFETGMFHALREGTEMSSREWLPIREGPPEEAPFDFRTMQMVTVPREENQELRKDKFTSDLTIAVKELLATEFVDPTNN